MLETNIAAHSVSWYVVPAVVGGVMVCAAPLSPLVEPSCRQLEPLRQIPMSTMSS